MPPLDREPPADDGRSRLPSSPGTGFQPLGRWARLAQAALGANAVLKLVFLLAVGLAAAGRASPALSSALSTLDRLAWVFVPCALALPAVICRRVLANLRWLGERDLTHTPGTAAAIFFVPVAQVQMGYAVLEEVWERSARAAGLVDDQVVAQELLRVARFWRFLVLGALISYVGARLVEMPLIPELGVLAVLGVGLSLQLCADVSGLWLVEELRRRHDRLGS